MAQYIEKDKVIAEIERMLEDFEETLCDEISFNHGKRKALEKLKKFIDALETKDPDKEYNQGHKDCVMSLIPYFKTMKPKY